MDTSRVIAKVALASVSLDCRCSTLKGFQFGASIVNVHDVWERRHINLKTPSTFHLRYEAGIGQRWGIAEAKITALLIGCKQGFECVEARIDPGGTPSQYGSVIAPQSRT